MKLSDKKKYSYPGETKFVTFFSYKGGVGRTLALANAAALVAAAGRKVLAMDADLEAPGLATLFKEQIKNTKARGLVEYIQALKKQLPKSADKRSVDSSAAKTLLEKPDSLKEPDFKDYITGVSLDSLCRDNGAQDGSQLDLMPAGLMDDMMFASRVQNLDVRGMYEGGYGIPLFHCMKEFIKKQNYDFVLIDARTGFSEMGIVATYDLADAFVFLSGLNEQNLAGMKTMLTSMEENNPGFKDRTKVFVASPVPLSEEHLKEERFERFESALGRKPHIVLQYHPRLALTEELFCFEFPKNAISKQYRKLAELIRLLAGDSAERWFDEAREARSDKEYENELNCWKQMHTIEPDFTQVNLSMRLGSADELSLEIGRQFFDFFVSITPDNDFAPRNMLAKFLIEFMKTPSDSDFTDSDFRQADQLAKEVIASYAAFLKSHQPVQAFFYETRDNLQCAREQIEKAITQNDKKPDNYSNDGVALSVLGKITEDNKYFDQAIMQFEKAEQLEPGSGAYGMACTYALMMDARDKALWWLEKAVQYKPSFKQQARTDKDFEALWDDPEFKRITAGS